MKVDVPVLISLLIGIITVSITLWRVDRDKKQDVEKHERNRADYEKEQEKRHTEITTKLDFIQTMAADIRQDTKDLDNKYDEAILVIRDNKAHIDALEKRLEKVEERCEGRGC